MRTFKHPNMHKFKCPICRKNTDKPITLIGIPHAIEGNIQQAQQIHIDCLKLIINESLGGFDD